MIPALKTLLFNPPTRQITEKHGKIRNLEATKKTAVIDKPEKLGKRPLGMEVQECPSLVASQVGRLRGRSRVGWQNWHHAGGETTGAANWRIVKAGQCRPHSDKGRGRDSIATPMRNAGARFQHPSLRYGSREQRFPQSAPRCKSKGRSSTRGNLVQIAGKTLRRAVPGKVRNCPLSAGC